MPFDLTPDQIRALGVLDWLYSDANRRQGRTWVLAISCLRRLVLGGEREVELEDHHVQERGPGDRVLFDYIRGIAENLNLDLVYVSRHRIRLGRFPTGNHLRAVTEALTEFGTREPFPSVGMLFPGRYARYEAIPIQTRGNPINEPTTAAPRKSLWEHLEDDSDGI